jgi:hypothetical protein
LSGEAPEKRYPEYITDFGAERDGSQPLSYVGRIPDDTIAYLKGHITRIVEGDEGPNQEFRDALEAWLTPELLFAEWARLRSTAGLPVKVPYKGRKYPAAIRMQPRFSRLGDPGMEEMSDGAPVQIQRWTTSSTETGSTATTTELRSLNQGFDTGLSMTHHDVLGLAVNARPVLSHGQMAETPTVTQAEQSFQILRSTGKSDPFEFTMDWEARPGDSVSELFAGRLPDDDWEKLPDPDPALALKPLVVWFPKYSSAEQGDLADSAKAQSGIPDARKPAPFARLKHEFPHFGIITLRNHDQLLADVAASFPPLRDLSENSREDLLAFLSEGDLRTYIPSAWDGHVPSPTLYDQWGNPVGYLRYSVDITGGDRLTGPVTANSVMESVVLRQRRAAQSAAVTDAAGIQVPITLTLGSPEAPDGSTEGLVTLQPGYQHSFSHTLASGGSARVASSIRSKQALLEVTPDVTFQFDLVSPLSAPLQPAADSPLHGGKAFQAQVLVPSVELVEGKQDAPTRYLPPELETLTHIALTITPLEVAGTSALFTQAETLLRRKGYLPSDEAEPTVASQLGKTNATLGQLLDNQRRFDQFRSRLGLRARLSELVEGAGSVWFQAGDRRIRLNLAATRATGADSATKHERAIDVPTLNYSGSTLSGDEQFGRTPGSWSLTVGGGAENMLTRDHGTAQIFKEVLGEVVGSTQKSSIVDSSSGTQHEDYLLPPIPQGSQVFSVPVQYAMTALQGQDELMREQAHGHVRLAVPTYRALDAPSTATPSPATVRAADADDKAALDNAPAVDGADGIELADVGRGLYRNGRLRIPQSAIIDGMAGSRELTKAVIDTLNGRIADGTRAVTEGNAAAADDEADEMPRMPGAFPSDNQGPLLPTMQHPVPPAQAPAVPTAANDGLLARWQRRAFDYSLVTPESFATELLETALSPVFLKAHAQRMLRDQLIVEGIATPGLVADRTFRLALSAYLKDVRVLEATDPMDAERWQQSPSVSSHADSTTTSLGGGAVVEGNFGGFQDYRPGFQPTGTYVGSVSWSKSETVSDSTAVWRVTNEDSAHGYRVRGTVVYVAEVTQTWRNAVGGVVTETARLVRNAVGALTDTTPDEAAPLGRTDRLAVEMPEGIEFFLFKNDFQTHPELLHLPGVNELSPDRRPDWPAQPAEDDPRLPSRFVTSGGVLGFGVASEVEFHGGRGTLEKAIRDLVGQVAPGAVQPGFNTSLNGVQARINQISTGQGPTGVVNAGPNGRVAFHWIDRNTTGHRLVEVAVTARPRVDLSAVRGRRLAGTAGLDNVIAHANADGSSIGKPGVVSESNTQARTHTLTASLLATQGSPSEGESSRSHGASFNMSAAGSSTGRSHTAPREVRAWERSMGHTNQYVVEYDYHVEVTSRILNEAVVTWLLSLPASVTSSVIDQVMGDGTVEWLLSRVPYAEWFVPGMTYHRSADVPADVYLRFNDSETPKPGHVEVITPVPARVLRHDPVQPPARKADDTPGLVALRDHLSRPSWRPSRPIAVYDFNGYDAIREALLVLEPRLASTPARLTQSLETLNIVLTGWASGGAARLTLAEAGHFGLTPQAWTTAFRIAPTLGTEVTLTIYDSLIELSSRDQAIDGLDIATDAFGPSANTTSAPSVTFSAYEPLRGSTIESFRPSIPLLGQSRSRGGYAQQASARRAFIRFGTPAENARLEGLPGHLIHGVVVIRLRNGSRTRWVVGHLQFRATETPTGATAAFPYATEADTEKATAARQAAERAVAERAAAAEAATTQRVEAEQLLAEQSRAVQRAEERKTSSERTLANHTRALVAARIEREEAARGSTRRAAEHQEAEDKRNEAERKAALLAERKLTAEDERDAAAVRAKAAERDAQQAVTERDEAIGELAEKRKAEADAEAERVAAERRIAELRPGDQPTGNPYRELAAAERRVRELTGAAKAVQTKLETAERSLTAARGKADKRQQEAQDAVRKATKAAAEFKEADDDLSALTEKAEKAKAEADKARAEAREAAEEASKQEASERRAREQAQTDQRAVDLAQADSDAAKSTAAQRRAAESTAEAERKTAETKVDNSRVAEKVTKERVEDTTRRQAEREAASALDLADSPPGSPVRLDSRLVRTSAPTPPATTAGQPATIAATIAGPSTRAEAPLPAASVVLHTFDLSTLVARRGGRIDGDQLLGDLLGAIGQKVNVTDPGALARTGLTLRAGEPGLVALGLKLAGRVAVELKHRVVFISGPGAKPVNICP